MDWDKLRIFQAAAQAGSFTHAGEALNMSQSAVSRQVQQLEDSIGAALFERQHRALALTDAGRIMRRAVEDSLERLRDAAARVRGTAGKRQVTVMGALTGTKRGLINRSPPALGPSFQELECVGQTPNFLDDKLPVFDQNGPLENPAVHRLLHPLNEFLRRTAPA